LKLYMLIIGDYTQNKRQNTVCGKLQASGDSFPWLQQISNKNVFVTKLSLSLSFSLSLSHLFWSAGAVRAGAQNSQGQLVRIVRRV